MQAITTCLRKSFDFSGRASRAEFWWFFLVTLVIAVGGFFLIDLQLYGLDLDDPTSLAPFADTFFLLTAPASVTVTKRRINDITNSDAVGWLAVLIVIIGFILSFIGQIFDLFENPWFAPIEIIFIILGLLVLIANASPSTPGPNRYGPNPHEVTP